MKTTNNVQKTENGKLENSAITTLVLAISLVLISITGSANVLKNHLEVNQGHEEMIGYAYLAPVVHSTEVVINANDFLFETSAEKNLEIESWMTNEKYFGSKMSDPEVELEAPLIMEDWMLANQIFSGKTNNTEGDSALKVEDWMVDKSIWGN